jgi:hypothetical protein
MAAVTNKRPPFDKVIVDLANYAHGYKPKSKLAFETARLTLIDSLACAFEALAYPDCTKLLGPVVPGTIVPNGARVPGTSYVLDPVTAAFNAGALIRWLDFNDAFYGRTMQWANNHLLDDLPADQFDSFVFGKDPQPDHLFVFTHSKAVMSDGCHVDRVQETPASE